MPENDAFTNLQRLMKQRYSCRGYLPDQIPDEVILSIVKAEQQVPSWCNAQPWRVAITRGAQTDRFREKLFAAAMQQPGKPDFDFPVQYAGVYKERRSVTGWQLYDVVGVKKGDRAASAAQMMRNFQLFDAPHVAIVTSEADLGTYGVLDCGAFVSAFMIAAQAMGIASIAQGAVAGQAPVVREFFDLPENRKVVCAISFGLEDVSHPANGFRTGRADVAEVIDWY